MLKVHCGGNYFSFAKMLEEKLKTAKSRKDLGDLVEKFEAFQAQTKLPLVRKPLKTGMKD
mgnify:CR=1 FL=1